MTKLSPRMQDVVDKMRDGWTLHEITAGPNPGPWLQDSTRPGFSIDIHRATLSGLRQRDIVRRVQRRMGGVVFDYELTPEEPDICKTTE